MRVPQGVPFLITDCFEELVDPDGGINREALLIERFDLYRASARLYDGPEPGHTHDGSLS